MARRAAPVTERQEKWFRTVVEGLERDTGKSLDDWVAIARTCPETTARGRAIWFKERYGIGVNRLGAILERAFPSEAGWDDPDALLAALWTDPAAAAIYAKVAAVAETFPDVTIGPRKAFVGFSRKVQFAAIRPVKGGGARLDLAVPLPAGGRFLTPRKSEGWSDRLHTIVMLATPEDVDAGLKSLLRAAFDRS